MSVVWVDPLLLEWILTGIMWLFILYALWVMWLGSKSREARLRRDIDRLSRRLEERRK